LQRTSANARGEKTNIGKLFTIVNRYVGPLADKNEVSARIWLRLALGLIVRTDVLLRHICAQARPGDVIYDVGAGNGMYSLVLARRVVKSLVYAFEPNMKSHALLVKNIRLMGLQGRVVPIRIALDDLTRKRMFFISSKATRSSLHRSGATRNGYTIIGSYEIDCFRLDELVEDGAIRPPDIIKIDTEGNEFNVIRGATRLLQTGWPMIGIEPHALDEVGDTGKRVVQYLSELGYEFSSLGYPIWFYKRNLEQNQSNATTRN